MSEPESVATSTDVRERRQRLLALKLQALARDHLGGDPAVELSAFAGGAAALVGASGWVLLDQAPHRGLGGALIWAHRAGVERLHVLAETATGLLARRASRFTLPIEVWHVDNRQLLPAVAEPLLDPPPAKAEHLELTGMIEAAGATPRVEHSVVLGEVRGLEVCRVLEHDDGVALEVGVGAHDREAFGMIHGHIPTLDALTSVVREVAERRGTDVPLHPLNRLAQERFLRWRLEQTPSLIDADEVLPAEPPVQRPNLKDPVPCVATARRDDADVAVVCSVGVDLDLIPYTADVQARGLHTAVVVPSRDLVPATRELASLLTQPVELRTV